MPPTLVAGDSARVPESPAVTERDGNDARRSARRIPVEWLLAAMSGVALAALMFWPIVRHPATRIPADIGDPTLQAWQMAWAGHILRHDPGELWHANAFYPERYSYVFSDTLLGYAPAGLLGTGSVAALVRYNCVFVLAFALAFTGTYALVRQLGAGRLAATVAGIGFAYAPWHWNQAGHLHVLSTGGIALSLAMLARGHGVTLRAGAPRGRQRPGWALAGWVVAAWQITLGFGIGIPFGYVMGGLAIAGTIWVLRRRVALPRRLIGANAVGVFIFLLVTGAMAYPYLRMISEHPYARRSINDLEFASPPLVGLFTAPGRSVVWGPLLIPVRMAMSAPTEQTLFPGLTLYALAVLGLVVSVWSLRARLWLLGGAVFSAYLSLGVNAPFGHHVGYVSLFRYVPGWDAIRTPGRLTIWTTLLLALLAAGALAELGRRAGVTRHLARLRPRAAVAGLTLGLAPLAVLGEGLHRLDFPVVPPAPAAMRTAADPLLVLPTTQETDENVMLWSVGTWPRIVNGGSGFTPREQGQLREELKAFPDAHTVRKLRAIGVRTVIVLKVNPVAPNNRDYARAADPTVDITDLGIVRTQDQETIRYDLSGG